MAKRNPLGPIGRGGGNVSGYIQHSPGRYPSGYNPREFSNILRQKSLVSQYMGTIVEGVSSAANVAMRSAGQYESTMKGNARMDAVNNYDAIKAAIDADDPTWQNIKAFEMRDGQWLPRPEADLRADVTQRLSPMFEGQAPMYNTALQASLVSPIMGDLYKKGVGLRSNVISTATESMVANIIGQEDEFNQFLAADALGNAGLVNLPGDGAPSKHSLYMESIGAAISDYQDLVPKRTNETDEEYMVRNYTRFHEGVIDPTFQHALATENWELADATMQHMVPSVRTANNRKIQGAVHNARLDALNVPTIFSDSEWMYGDEEQIASMLSARGIHWNEYRKTDDKGNPVGEILPGMTDDEKAAWYDQRDSGGPNATWGFQMPFVETYPGESGENLAGRYSKVRNADDMKRYMSAASQLPPNHMFHMGSQEFKAIYGQFESGVDKGVDQAAILNRLDGGASYVHHDATNNDYIVNLLKTGWQSHEGDQMPMIDSASGTIINPQDLFLRTAFLDEIPPEVMDLALSGIHNPDGGVRSRSIAYLGLVSKYKPEQWASILRQSVSNTNIDSTALVEIANGFSGMNVREGSIALDAMGVSLPDGSGFVPGGTLGQAVLDSRTAIESLPPLPEGGYASTEEVQSAFANHRLNGDGGENDTMINIVFAAAGGGLMESETEVGYLFGDYDPVYQPNTEELRTLQTIYTRKYNQVIRAGVAHKTAKQQATQAMRNFQNIHTVPLVLSSNDSIPVTRIRLEMVDWLGNDKVLLDEDSGLPTVEDWWKKTYGVPPISSKGARITGAPYLGEFSDTVTGLKPWYTVVTEENWQELGAARGHVGERVLGGWMLFGPDGAISYADPNSETGRSVPIFSPNLVSQGKMYDLNVDQRNAALEGLESLRGSRTRRQFHSLPSSHQFFQQQRRNIGGITSRDTWSIP